MNNERKTIFLVDDDMTSLILGKKALSGTYDVFAISVGTVLFEMLESKLPDLILLDIHMPEMDGYETIKLLKGNEKTAHIPVIFLTANNDEKMEVKGLSVGAIDYITKPFSASVLLKRVEIHLRNAALRQASSAEVAEYGPLTFDMKSLTAYVNGVDMLLTKKDFALLLLLVKNENSYRKTEDLYQEVWGRDMNQDSQAIRSAASRLRTKLEGSGYSIVNERKKGYCFRREE